MNTIKGLQQEGHALIEVDNVLKKVVLPHYRKSEAHIFKVFSATHCISVLKPWAGQLGNTLMVAGNIDIAHASLAFSNETKECSEKDWQVAYNITEEKLRHLANRPARTNPEAIAMVNELKKLNQ